MAETLRELVVALSLDSSNFSRNIFYDSTLYTYFTDFTIAQLKRSW